MRLVPLSEIREVSKLVGYPSDKSHLIAKLKQVGAQCVIGKVDGGQTGFLYVEATLPRKLIAHLIAKPISNPDAVSETMLRIA